MKKTTVFALLFTLTIVWSLSFASSNTYASAKNDPNLTNQELKKLGNIYKETKEGTEVVKSSRDVEDVVDGTFLYTLDTTTTKTVKKDNKKGIVTIHMKNDYQKKFPNGQIENSSDENNISYNKKGEMTIDGQDLTGEELNETALPQMRSLASGGKSYLTYYRQTSSRTYYVRAYEEPTNYFLDGGAGTPLEKKWKYGTKLVDFKNLAGDVASARNTILTSSATIAGAIGVGTVSWWTVVALIGAGTTAGVAALTLYQASNSGKSAMKEAYNLL